MSARTGLCWWLLAGLLICGVGMVAASDGMEAKEPAIGRLLDARTESHAGGVSLYLKGDSDLTYHVFLLEDPYRVVLDLAGVAVPIAVAAPGGADIVQGLRYSLWKDDAQEPVVRYVIETRTQPRYRVESAGQDLILWVECGEQLFPEELPSVLEQTQQDESSLGLWPDAKWSFEDDLEEMAGAILWRPGGPEGAVEWPTSDPEASDVATKGEPGAPEAPIGSGAENPLTSIIGELEDRMDSVQGQPDVPVELAPAEPKAATAWIPSEPYGPDWGPLLVPMSGLSSAVVPESSGHPPAEEWVASADPTEPRDTGVGAWEENADEECPEVWGEALILPASGDERTVLMETLPGAETTDHIETPAEQPAEVSPQLAEAFPAPSAASADAAAPQGKGAEEGQAVGADDLLRPAADATSLLPEAVAEKTSETPQDTGTEAQAPEDPIYDPFKSLIERHREAAAERAQRDWTENRRRHDMAPTLGDADADFTVSTPRSVPPMSLDVQGADIRTVLRSISEYADVNIVADQNVKGKVTLRALDLPWRDMLQTICRAMSLVAQDHGAVIRVATERAAQEEVLARESTERKKEEFMPLETKIMRLRYSNAAELQDVLNKMCTNRGNAEVDGRTNSLILTDIAPRLKLLEEMLQELDSQTMQVEITAELVDIDVTESAQLGISWGLQHVHSPSFNGSGYGVVDAADDVLLPAGTIEFGVIRSFGEIRAKIQALASENKADFISTPRITTVNNRMARILVGKEVPLITMDEAGNAIVELKKVGISLEVTPYVNSEDQITLDLHPEVSDLSSQSTVQGGVVFTTTEADTRVMVGDGETAVIGGLIAAKRTEFKRGIPYLMDIPILGNLFRSSDIRSEKRELLVFVTPRIVRAN